MKNHVDINTVMAATVHDVKNALSLIDTQIHDVLRSDQHLSPDSAQQLNRIRLEAGRINNDLVHMLGLYRMHNDTFRPTFDEVLVEDVINDACARHTETLQALGIHLNIDLHDPDLVWFMDPMLVEGILANALTNSTRYTHDRLDFHVFERDGGLCIQLIDNGTGYPEKMMNFMGKGEDQGDLNFQTGSTGLGLFFCHQIARLHTNGDQEGHIHLSNHPETGGAVFELWLP